MCRFLVICHSVYSIFEVKVKINTVGSQLTLVSLAAVFSVVTQRSSPQTAAHIRTTSLSFCSLCANKITDIVSYVTNQSTGDCNQRFFRHSQVLQVPDYKKSEFLQWRKHQRDGCFICSTAVQKKRQKLYIWKKVLSLFRLLLFPVWMWTWAAIHRPASVLEMTYQVQKGLCSSRLLPVKYFFVTSEIWMKLWRSLRKTLWKSRVNGKITSLHA